ncbi:sorting nexin-11 isoform X3 [Corvus hawaiiensis]|uniref:sorting nexin-11 isoform X3 n=1 Tax=Corvus hawaiiensis TaxID=134902 RepID=UPI00201A045A|nr:sorting nexin-11 isoform X3 [Corvus hawaiiensis]
MLENREEELTTVRVQDPRVQNEGSWNSYVDYKIFLHTNSKAFTAKTSCVRRRYREFVWLRRQLQKNAGLVPVPELPGKSAAFFVGSTDEFIEKRRQGLQQFLEKVLQSVVLLSDSRLHLFLQSQLPVPAIEACVQGRGPHGVTEAILRYAMAPCAWGHRGHGPAPAPAPPGHPGDVCAGLGSAQGCLESFPYWGDFGMDEARPESPAGHGVTPLESPAGHGVTPLESPESPAGHGVTPLESLAGHGVTPSPESLARHGVTPLESPESPAGHGVTPLESPAGHGVTPLESPAGHGVTPLESPAGHGVTPLESLAGHGVTPLESPESPAGHGVTPLESLAGHGVTPLESLAGHGVTPLESPAGHGVTPLESLAGHGVTPLEEPPPGCPARHGVTPLESPESPAGHGVTPLEEPPRDVRPDTE